MGVLIHGKDNLMHDRQGTNVDRIRAPISIFGPRDPTVHALPNRKLGIVGKFWSSPAHIEVIKFSSRFV